MHISSNTIIHVQREDHLLPFILFCRRNPKLCTLHGNSADKMYLKKGKLVGRIYIEVEKFALIRVDKIIAVDKGTRDYYVSKYKWLDEKIEVVPIGIDLTLFRPMPKNEMKKKYGLEYEKIIVFIGRQEKEKNLHFLLNAFKNLKYEKRSCCLLLVGSGREHDALKEEAFRQNLKNVVFMDTLEHKYIPEILNCADVFALCSLFESGPLVVQEAIACGVPVVSTNVGRVKDFIADEHIGKIVDYDEIEFARALDTYLSLGSNDIAHIRGIAENFSFNKTADSFIEIYKKLSKNGKLV
jgi:glycosyltransferase involved in cell wall biosynthesis